MTVQREIAERLRAGPGTRLYGAPSVIVQLACEVELLRTVDPAVFAPRPRVESALLSLRRRAEAAPERMRALVHEAFAHRRKTLPRSLELAGGIERARARAALRELDLPEDARAETLSPAEFARLDALIAADPAARDKGASPPRRPTGRLPRGGGGRIDSPGSGEAEPLPVPRRTSRERAA